MRGNEVVNVVNAARAEGDFGGAVQVLKEGVVG